MQNAKLGALCALFFLAITLACHAAPTASTDLVAIEDWTYDALMSLAAQGLVPDVPAQRFMGDWVYSREEMAGFVKSALAIEEQFSGENRVLLARLTAEFLPELQLIGTDPALISKIGPNIDAQTFNETGSFQPRITRSGGDTHLIGIYDASAIGTTGRYITLVTTLSDQRRKFDGDEFSRLEKAFIRGRTPNWEWEFGRDFLRWGPGYSGSMILSDNSPEFTMFKLAKDVNFGKRIGNIKISQFISSFEDNGQRFYFLGRRWEKRFSKYFHAGFNETAKTSESPNPIVLVLPLFYMYEQMFLDDIDAEWNSLISVDALYKFSPRFEAYAEYLIDDMSAPSFAIEGPVANLPRKVGYLAGFHWPDLFGDGTTGLRAEAIVIDVGTYAPTRPTFPELAYTHDGLVIGHPVGPNSEAIFLRADRKLTKGWTGIVEYLGRRPRVSDGPNPDNTSSLSLLAVRDISSPLSLTFRYDRFKLPETENRAQVGLAYAF